MSCNICCEVYNKSSRAKICCPYCEYVACRTCCETYLLSESIAKCMNTGCAKEWHRKFLKETFTNTFLNTKYKEHIENVLFDQEKALMPDTQPLVEEKKAKIIIKQHIKKTEEAILKLMHKKRSLEYSLENGKHMAREKSVFIRQCPYNDCRGFLSTQWKCGICENWTCPDCHELKGLVRDCPHTCNADNVESAKLLSKDSKPCPKCQSLIFKIDGCDQIWCTQCHIAFCWKTGKLEKNIHNPHYFEWQRKNGGGVAPRNEHDIECGRILNNFVSANFFALSRNHSDLYFKTDYHPIIKKYGKIIEISTHNYVVVMPQYRVDYVLRNQNLRILYLENGITEEEFKRSIQKNDKKNRQNTEIYQVLNLLNTVIIDIVFRLIDEIRVSENSKHDVCKFEPEFSEIIKHCNSILKEISFTYNSILYEFDDVCHFIKKKVKKQVTAAASEN